MLQVNQVLCKLEADQYEDEFQLLSDEMLQAKVWPRLKRNLYRHRIQALMGGRIPLSVACVPLRS